MYIFGEESDEDEKGIPAEREYLHGAAQQSQREARNSQKLVQPGRKGSVGHRITKRHWNKGGVYEKDIPKWVSVPEWAQKEWWAV